MPIAKTGCGAFVAAMLCAAPASAVTFYYDRDEWETAVSALGLPMATQTFDDFEDTASGELPDVPVGPVEFTDVDVGLSGDSGVRSGALVETSGNLFFRAGGLEGPPLRAMGFDHSEISNRDFTALNDVNGGRVEDFSREPGGIGFSGFVLDSSEVLDFGRFNVTTGEVIESFDNLSVGYQAAETSAVPLPSSALLLLSGLGALALRRRG